jgi:23S rRNA (uracil1939-C5)-methyltransferase
VFRVLDPPTERDVDLLRAFGDTHGIRMGLQRAGPDSVECLDGGALNLGYSLPAFDVDIEFGPTDFVQVNATVNRLMVSRAVSLLDPEPGQRVLDLFCGIGNFSLPLARQSGYVLGIEVDARQVRRGRENAKRNGIENCEFRQADLADIDASTAWLSAGWDRMLLDPARSGAREVVAHADTIGADRIVYVSCHPGTLARDAGVLVREKGYRLEAAGIIDMFAHTGHVESLAVFQKS